MNHVPRPWLRRFQFGLIAIDVIVLGLYAAAIASGESPSFQTIIGRSHEVSSRFGITTIMAGLAGAHMIYTLGFVSWLDKRNTWLVHTIGASLSGLLLVLLTNSGSQVSILQDIALVMFAFFATIVGTVASGLTISLAFIYLIVNAAVGQHLAADPSSHVIKMIMVNMAGISSIAGWFIFSKRYVHKSDPRAVESLKRLVNQEQTTTNLILESITDGVMIIDTSGVVEALNASCAKILGWPKEEARNLQYSSLLVAADPAGKPGEETPKNDSVIAKTFENGEAQQQVSLYKTRDDHQVYLDVTSSPIVREATGQGAKSVVGAIVVLRDVDKQKREQEQRSEFISTASHEMRTPVAAIEGYLALALNNKVSTIDEKARSYIEKAHSSTQHLGKLFQDLLTSAKAEDGRLVSHPKVIEMGNYLEQLVDTLRFTAEKKGLLLDFTIGTGGAQDPNTINNGRVIKPLYYTHADPDRMREVITNLFDNAVKYTEAGKISIGLTGNNDVVQFFIKDTGPGIPAADINHLFQKFYRVDSSATRTIGGTGLGLFICRKIVELYKGHIWVESDYGKGSTFYINLPRLANQRADQLIQSEKSAEQTASPLDKQ